MLWQGFCVWPWPNSAELVCVNELALVFELMPHTSIHIMVAGPSLYCRLGEACSWIIQGYTGMCDAP